MNDVILNIRNFKWPRNAVLTHSIFWIALILVLSVVDVSGVKYGQKLIIEVINIAFYAVIVYFNFFYLFPSYIKDKDFFKHILALTISAAVITPIKSLILFLTTSNPNIQGFFIDNQYFIFLSTLFVGIAATLYFVILDWLSTQREKQELASENLQSELKFLKSQINPHFLFNTLNSLYALTLKKSDQAPEIVLKLSEMMRYMLYDCNEKFVPLEKEVSYLNNYLDLERLRHGKKMEIHFELEGDIDNQMIAPLLFIPFVENCFKHGISNRIENGFVNIKLKINENSANLIVENSKAPIMPSTNVKRSGGIGLVNVQRRLDLLYPQKYQLDIATTPNVYSVSLNIKLSND